MQGHHVPDEAARHRRPWTPQWSVPPGSRGARPVVGPPSVCSQAGTVSARAPPRRESVRVLPLWPEESSGRGWRAGSGWARVGGAAGGAAAPRPAVLRPLRGVRSVPQASGAGRRILRVEGAHGAPGRDPAAGRRPPGPRRALRPVCACVRPAHVPRVRTRSRVSPFVSSTCTWPATSQNSIRRCARRFLRPTRSSRGGGWLLAPQREGDPPLSRSHTGIACT